MTTFEKRLKEIEARHSALIAETNKLIPNGTQKQLEEKFSALKQEESDYRNLRQKEVFTYLADVHEALQTYQFATLSSAKVSKDGHLTGIKSTVKVVQIDLKQFCEFKELPLDWYYEMQALNKRLTLKAMIDLGVSEEERAAIDDSYAMDDLAKKISLGETPTSNTQVIAHIQRVLDMLSKGEGRVNGHDLTYIWMLYGKQDRKSLRVVCAKHAILQSLLTTVFHNVSTGMRYGVDYKRLKDTGVTAPTRNSKKKAEVSEKEEAIVQKAEVSETTAA